MPCNMKPNQFERNFWSLSLQLHLLAIFLLLMKCWCLLTKNYILHHTNQSYRCEDWNMKAEDLDHPQCHLAGRDKSTLSSCNNELKYLSFPSSPQYQKLVCLPHHDVHSCACTVSNPPKISCWVVDQWLIPCNELMKHGFDDFKEWFMICSLGIQ